MALNISQQMMASVNLSKYCLVLPLRENVSAERYSIPNTHPAILAYMYLVGIFSVTGSFANLLVLTVVLLFSSLRKGVGILIPHLLICQTVVCAILCPVLLAGNTKKNVKLHYCESCRYIEPLLLTLSYIINWSDSWLALNRFVAVIFPTKFGLINRPGIQVFALILSWFVVLLTTVPPMFDVWAVYRMSPGGACVVLVKSKTAEFLMAFNVYCPLAMVAVSATCIAIKMTLTNRNRHLPGRVKPESESPAGPAQLHRMLHMSKRLKRMSRMLLASFVCSLACQLPQFIAVMVVYKGARDPLVGVFLGLWALLQYSFTPIIYVVGNKDYQQKIGLLWAHVRGSSIPPTRQADSSTLTCHRSARTATHQM
ncbi:hypothetical protein BV898_03287 [Hypsibius exemplaris]|uniref:G-protein coupled receptors family 1 profile domain-containing protein n=1 Tax=Hypsibius exemplaris TaxID=2072580 RepID=A0A1W0X5T3_HYPEX|nr:hypothetical protein BV898_03287 [Hypsibius exemplaris]